MTHRDPFEHCYLVSHLGKLYQSRTGHQFDLKTDHMFASGHKSLVDDLRGVISPCVNVNTLFHHRV